MLRPITSSGCSLRPEAAGDAQDQTRLRRRSAVEPVIGHLKSEHRMGRNYLWHRQGNATNAVLAAAGYNFRRLLRRLQLLLRQILAQLILRLQLVPSWNPDSSRTTRVPSYDEMTKASYPVDKQVVCSASSPLG